MSSILEILNLCIIRNTQKILQIRGHVYIVKMLNSLRIAKIVLDVVDVKNVQDV